MVVGEIKTLIFGAGGMLGTDLCPVFPDVVINAAAYTAEGCARAGSVLVHYSTDYIFNGSKKEYVEADSPNPINYLVDETFGFFGKIFGKLAEKKPPLIFIKFNKEKSAG